MFIHPKVRSMLFLGTLSVVAGSGSRSGKCSSFLGSNQLGELIQINPSTGAGQLLGDVSPCSTEVESDPITGRLFSEGCDGDSNIYELDTSTGSILDSIAHEFGALNGLEFAESTLYGTFIDGPNNPSDLVKVDLETGDFETVGPTGFGPISGLAYSHGTMYGSTAGFAPATLVTIDLHTGAATEVGPIVNSVDGSAINAIGSIEFGPDGDLYGAGAERSELAGLLFKIDQHTAVATIVGDTRFGTITGLTCSPLLFECEVDCDRDSDCAPGLQCADAHKDELRALDFDERKAYCGEVGAPTEEVCYDPNKTKLGECEFDCDRDSDCQDGLLCADEHKDVLIANCLDMRKAYCDPNDPNLDFTDTLEVCYDPTKVTYECASPLVPPSNSRLLTGKTFEEWTATWWQWALKQKVTGHPGFDDTGELCNSAQPADENVFFLIGTFSGGPVVRTMCDDVPEGKFLFFPLINRVCADIGVPPEDDCALEVFNGVAGQAQNLFLDVDGTSIDVNEELDRGFFFESDPLVFQLPPFDDPSDNLFGLNCTEVDCENLLAISAGYWAMLGPPATGAYNIHFGGERVDLMGSVEASVDVSYTPLEVED